MPSLSSIVSRSTVTPDSKSSLTTLKLSVSDLPMLSCQYIQKGVLFTKPPIPIDSLISLLKRGLSETLKHFSPLAGRLVTDSNGFVHITCNDSGVEFVHANAQHVTIHDILSPIHVPRTFREFFALDGAISYDGHYKPLMAVQVTELADGIFIGCTVNHAVTDGTSFWNFFNSFAEICKGAKKVTKQPDFTRNFFNGSPAVLSFPDGSPKVTFDVNAPLEERIFKFSREAILELKSRANSKTEVKKCINSEILGKQSNDNWFIASNEKEKKNGKITAALTNWLISTGTKPVHEEESKVQKFDPTAQISSFQALSAQLWRSVTRARKLAASKPTTFRMAVNCRHRLEPAIDPLYFGNAIQSIPTIATAGEVLSGDLQYSADLLHRNVVAYNDAKVRRGVEDFEKNPRVFPLGNFDGAMITMGSSPRFPMYNNDFGWGRPLAVRSGRANKFDGKISAFPGREGGGSVDLEVCLHPETMKGLESDMEFMQYVSAK
ncbi:hypothetical protein ACHQM5_013716 [Ranunculus cassubicifolius]